MKKSRLTFIKRIITLSIFIVGVLVLYGCTINEVVTPNNIYVNETNDTIKLGIKNQQEWVFKKSSDLWLFDGIYIFNNNKSSKLFVGTDGRLTEDNKLNLNGAYFSMQNSTDPNSFSQNVSNFIENIEIINNDEDLIKLKLSAKGFNSYLTLEKESEYIERSIEFDIPSDILLSEGEVSLALKTNIDQYNEYGFILGHENDVTQYSLPYAFPAIMTKLNNRFEDLSVSYVSVVDFYGTSSAFKTVRRQEHLNGFFELGTISSDNVLNKDNNNIFTEKIYLTTEEKSYYELIYSARKTYSEFYEAPLEELHMANGNMTVDNWMDASLGAVGDILDDRGRPAGEQSLWGPYGFNNGSAEAFGSMDILKGITRYAIASNDSELYEQINGFLTNIIRKDTSGKSWIMPLSKYKNIYSDDDIYFYRSSGSDGNFNPLDPSFTDPEDVFGSFKYYSRVLHLGELSMITERQDLKDAFLSLIPFILKMRGPNYEQDIQWNFDGTPSNYDYDNGGSMGAAAMWANVLYVASLIEKNETKSNEYFEHAKNSLEQSNKQDFPKTSVLRHYPKPESLGYSAKMNVIFYELTNDKKYLDKAIEVANAIHFYYFSASHPFTYYQTVGFSYADARERWEAFMEMVESAVLLTPLLKYTDDPYLLDMIYALESSALWALPVNGYPDGYLGGHSDWIDALYVPFEQPTASMGDNSIYDGGGMSYLRHSKELYGAGEIFTGALTYELYAKSYNKHVSIINTGVAIDTKLDNENQEFKIWNASKSDVSTPVFFNNFKEGNYEVIIDDKVIGIYNNYQLNNGIELLFKARTSYHAKIKKTNSENNVGAYNSEVNVTIENIMSNQTDITMNASNASFYKIETSYYENFTPSNTTTHYSSRGEITLYHKDSSNLYIKVYAINGHGVISEPTTKNIQTKDVEIGYLEDFDYENKDGKQKIPTWNASSLNYDGEIKLISDSNGFKDYPKGFKPPMGYMAIYKPEYSGYDIDTFTHELNVNITEYPLFDFYPYTKNIESKFSLTLKIGNEELSLINAQTSFNQNSYRFDLSKLTNKTGNQNITITIKVEGINRGFALSQLRFVKEKDYNNYDINSFNFTSSNATINSDSSLTISHDINNLTDDNYNIGYENLNNYSSLNFILNGVKIEHNRTVYANIDLYKTGETEPIISYKSLINYGQDIELLFNDYNMPIDANNYYVKVTFTKRVGNELVSEIKVKSIRLGTNNVKKDISIYKKEGNKYTLDGWSSNWGYINSETGHIYNGNPNVNYGSIYIRNIAVNLDETPIVRFKVSDLIPGTEFTLKVNDNNTFNEDLALNTQAGNAGEFVVNLRDRIKRGGVILLQFDFYVIGNHQNNGAKLEYIELLEGKVIYENNKGLNYSTSTSEDFLFDMNQTPYLFVDIEKITYQSEWKLYLEYEGLLYEVKTVYETVYGQMYSRTKIGAFKYDLRDILPENNDGVYNVKLIIKHGSIDDSDLLIRSIRLENNNEVPLIKQTTFK